MRPSPRRPAVAGGDGADAGRGGHPSARPHCRAFRQGEEAKSTSHSVISRQFVRQTETALAELMVRDVNRVEHQSAHARWRAHGRALRGGHAGHHRRRDKGADWAVGRLQENKTVVRALLADLVDAVCASTTGCWWSLDGAKALSAGGA
jgi:putative transposase